MLSLILLKVGYEKALTGGVYKTLTIDFFLFLALDPVFSILTNHCCVLRDLQLVLQLIVICNGTVFLLITDMHVMRLNFVKWEAFFICQAPTHININYCTFLMTEIIGILLHSGLSHHFTLI